MTKDELYKEAKVYANATERKASREIVQIAYIDAATPREKRIEELGQENRLLGERCNQLLKDKGDLTDKIADIKANCDLAIEGRDIEIMELEEKHKQEILDLVLSNSSERAELEKENEELIQENEEMKKGLGCGTCQIHLEYMKLNDKIRKLEKENAELKKEIEKHKLNNIFVEGCAGYDKKIAEEYTTLQERIEKLEKENAKLKKKYYKKAVKDYCELEKENSDLKERYNKVDIIGYDALKNLTKAKDHIKTLLDCLKQDTNDPQTNYYVCQYMDKAEQFLKEIGK